MALQLHTDVQALIKSKNRCLSRLIAMTEETLRSLGNALELVDFDQKLSRFDQDRTSLFRALELVDHEIQKAAPAARNAGPGALTALGPLIDEQKQLIQSLQGLDSSLIDRLEAALENQQKEIQSQNQAREKINRFRSAQRPESGEGLNQTL